MTTPSGYVSASGLTYEMDGPLEHFVRYIYEEYWADDLKHDKFVPEQCIRSHFATDVVWEYGGSSASPLLPIAGRYHGHEGMSAALSAFGQLLKVKVWEANAIVLAPSGAGTSGEVTAFVDLSAEYEIRESGTPIALDEVHVLRLAMGGREKEPQILGVRILFDELALATAIAPQNSMLQRMLSKPQRILGAEAPPPPPARTDAQDGEDGWMAVTLTAAIAAVTLMSLGAKLRERRAVEEMADDPQAPSSSSNQ